MNRTLFPIVAASLLVALPAQDPPTKALQRAQLLEQQEGDLAAAQQAYRSLLADATAKAVHAEAALGLGTLLWRLEQHNAATPFLQQAVAAGGDVGARANDVLQGQDPEGTQQAERLAKAQALAARVTELTPWGAPTEEQKRRLSAVTAELRLLGSIAARAAILEIERLRPLGVRIDENGRSDGGIDSHLRLVWTVGGPHAIDALTRWSQDPEVNWRRRVTQAIEAEETVAGDLRPLIDVYLRDSDPSREVPRSLARVVANLAEEELLGLVKSDDARLQRAGLTGLLSKFYNPQYEALDTLVRDTGDRVAQLTRSDDPAVASAAWRILQWFAGPNASANAVLCSVIDRMPDDMVVQVQLGRRGCDDAWIAGLAAAAERLGPMRSTSGSGGQAAIAAMLVHSDPEWTAAGAEAAVRLIELGYGKGPKQQGTGACNWQAHLGRRVDADQTVRVVALFDRIHVIDDLLNQLQQRPVPKAAFSSVRMLLSRRHAPERPDWMRERMTLQRVVAGNTGNVLTAGRSVHSLLLFAADSGHPEAAAWLWQQLEADATLAGTIASGLRTLSWRGDPAARIELRKLLVWPGTDQNELQPTERAEVLAELVRVGDEPTIELLPRACELGLQTTRPYYPSRGATEKPLLSVEAAGIGFLMTQAPESPSTASTWYGYDEPKLQRAWSTLLSSPAAADMAWSELAAANGGGAVGIRPTGNRPPRTPSTGGILPPSNRGVPVAVFPLLLERIPAWLATQRDTAPKAASAVVDVLGRSMRHCPEAAFAEGTPLHAALQQALRGADRGFAEELLHYVPSKVRVRLAEEARALVAGTESRLVLATVLQDGVELPDTLWQQLLQHRDPKLRIAALGWLRPANATRLRDAITAQLQVEQGEVRLAASTTMARLFGTEAVPALLPLLQDQDESVRNAVREQLERLRQDTEQRVFWQKAQAGIDTSRQGASAKLLLQAKVGEPKEQRLLALRSLAVLGVAETLPYLIDAANDADAEIAAAARAAITTIHQKGGAPAERPTSPPSDGK
ncbi:MAG: HEAT repeat domain-containing protein [Planctomycetes bacterium]|nr:HEAT repeat domain-containing protein [Planctomycetota bacterium]